jgi:PAS domain S-box-containing protein
MSSLLKKLLAPRNLEYLILSDRPIVVEMSAGVAQFADRPAEVAVGRDARLGFPELVGIERILEEIVEGKRVGFELKGIARSRDREAPLYVDLYISPDLDEQGDRRRLILVYENVTETMVIKQELLQRANEANLLLSQLSNAKTYLDRLIDSMADALIVTDRFDKIKTVNPTTLDLFGYEEGELIGQPISLLIPQVQLLRNSRSDLSSLSQNIEVSCSDRDGETLIVAFSSAEIQTDIQGFSDFLYLGKDVTQRVKSEAKIRKILAAEKELSELKNRFLSIASQEFRTPLNSIIFATEFLHQAEIARQDPEIQEMLAAIDTNVNRLRNLIENTTLVVQDNRDDRPFELNSANLIELCRDAIDQIQFSNSNRHEIVLVAPEPPLEIRADAYRLNQIIRRLLSNAIAYSPAETTVTLTLECPNDREIRITIADCGIGIPPEDRPALFEPLYRGKNVSHTPGLGLGLAIVKNYVELHSGRIQINSTLGEGTTAIVTLPVNPDRA